MADEAVVRIVVQDQGELNDSGPPENVQSQRPVFSEPFYPHIPPASQLPLASVPPRLSPPRAETNVAPSIPTRDKAIFDPYYEAEQMRAAEIRREKVKAAYDDLYETASRGKKTLDAVMDVATRLRGTLGGQFGPFVGSLLDLFAALRDVKRARQNPAPIESEYRNYAQTQAPMAIAPPKIEQPEATIQPAATIQPDETQQPIETSSYAPQQNAGILLEAAEALRALGHTQQESDRMLKSVTAAATQTFGTVQEIIRAAYAKPLIGQSQQVNLAPSHKAAGGAIASALDVPYGARPSTDQGNSRRIYRQAKRGAEAGKSSDFGRDEFGAL